MISVMMILLCIGLPAQLQKDLLHAGGGEPVQKALRRVLHQQAAIAQKANRLGVSGLLDVVGGEKDSDHRRGGQLLQVHPNGLAKQWVAAHCGLT